VPKAIPTPPKTSTNLNLSVPAAANGASVSSLAPIEKLKQTAKTSKATIIIGPYSVANFQNL